MRYLIIRHAADIESEGTDEIVAPEVGVKLKPRVMHPTIYIDHLPTSD